MSADTYLLLLGPALALVAGLAIYFMAQGRPGHTPAE